MSIVSLVGSVVTAFVFSATLALAAEDRSVDWGDLVDPSAKTYEDPYRDLSSQQIEALQTIVRNRAWLNDPTLSEARMADSAAKISAAIEGLAEDRIDADWLIDQRWIVADRREKAATAANPNLDGRTVTLAGYAIPAPVDADGATVVYLVPERGMCSHTPPPNANQMIRARVNSDWNPSTIHQPVRLTGTLSIEETNYSFRIVDGIVPMRASFIMDTTEVETAPVFGSPPQTTNEWATSIAERLRASGQLQDHGTSNAESP
ncbi:DUF3299 domain-containing protein [Roseovarius albus]|nr:DUF3299 domain-containing protein [Roseovarius albus]